MTEPCDTLLMAYMHFDVHLFTSTFCCRPECHYLVLYFSPYCLNFRLFVALVMYATSRRMLS